MALKSERKEWPYWCAALLLLLGCAACVWALFEKRPDQVCDCIVLGDSIYAEKREENPVAYRVFDASAQTVFNGAFGGTSLARFDQERYPDERMDAYSLAELTKSIVSKDFCVQRQITVEIPATEYFDAVEGELEKIDFSKAKVLLIGYGMNDYQNGVPLDDPKDPMNEYTFGGALRSTVTTLKKAFPQLRMILLTPTYSWYLEKGKSCEELDWGGGLLEDYVLLELEIGAACGVETIDLYHGLYETDSFENWSKYTRDGVHPNEAGMERIAGAIKQYLEEHPK